MIYNKISHQKIVKQQENKDPIIIKKNKQIIII